MKSLAELTPAETLLLTNGNRVPVKNLLKVTLMDLLLKQILKTVDVEHTFQDPTSQPNTYVMAGENFSFENTRDHEKVFLQPFLQSENRKILFANLVKLAYGNAGPEMKFNKVIRDSAPLSGCFVTGFPKLFNAFELTAHGKKLSSHLKQELEKLSETLPDLMHSNPARAREILRHIGGNIFLVKGIDFKRMVEIEKAVDQEIYAGYSVSNSTFADPITWLALDVSSSRFDNSCGGDTSSDFSDSGDSGCSGCSGCGSD